ncbi:MAG: N-acetyl-lysine deacetylase [Nitrososphaerota archaeon]|nr:N-acetyl-lysine deacetylase [Candidatus Calditenuaceae archaeon]MDW8073558.1 N-acetyl-lysine deacetylase [Nitrososphaerota archaeon]
MRVEQVLLELLSQYTPTGSEHRLAETMKGLAERLGYDDFEIDGAGNYLLRRGRGAKTLLLAGHVDTVPGELEWGLRGGEVYGRGAVDAKGPLAAMLVGASVARIDPAEASVIVAGLVDEEGEGRGAQELVRRGVRVDGAVVGEPTGGNGVAVSYRGSLTVRISATARGGHSSAPYMGDSALEKLLNVIQDIRLTFAGRSYEDPTSAVTQIRAGDWPTKLPESAEAIVNIRYPPGLETVSILERVEAAVSLYGCRMEVLDTTEPVATRLTSPVVRALTRSILRQGAKPRILKKTGASDMNILYRLTGNIAAYGPGNSLLAHTSEEVVSVADLEFAAKVIARAVEEFLSGSATAREG